jgi:hypothetical protein
MAQPEKKAAKRVRRALGKLTDKTAKRIEDVLDNPGGVNPQQLTDNIVGQFFDGVEAWLGVVRSFSGEAPTVFLDADTLGGGKNVSATVELDEPVNNVVNLTATSLISPGVAVPLAMVLAAVGPGPQVEMITITVNVPAGQAVGLYSGFVALQQVIQVKVYVWVHQ